MHKIPTMFVRDESSAGHPVIDQIKPECQWVLDGEGLATEEVDGTNVKIEHGLLFKRQTPKERDYDEASYAPCSRDNPADRWAFDGFDRIDGSSIVAPVIGELIGPKVQGNPYGHKGHTVIPIVPPATVLHIHELPDRSFATIREFLAINRMEGIVFHHRDGRMAKIKRRDFGLPWPIK